MSELIWQPPGSSLCGQCVVAMLTGTPLETVREEMGDGYTWPRDMRAMLDSVGYAMAKHSPKDKTVKVGPSGQDAVAFMQVMLNERMRGHWAFWDGEQWFDPTFGCMYRLPDECRASIYAVTEKE